MSSLTENIGHYLELQKQKFLLNVADKTSKVVAEMAVKIIFLLLIVVAFILLSFGLAALVNIWLHSAFWGYIIMAVVFSGLAALFYYRGKTFMVSFIVSDLLNLIYEDEEEDETI